MERRVGRINLPLSKHSMFAADPEEPGTTFTGLRDASQTSLSG